MIAKMNAAGSLLEYMTPSGKRKKSDEEEGGGKKALAFWVASKQMRWKKRGAVGGHEYYEASAPAAVAEESIEVNERKEVGLFIFIGVNGRTTSRTTLVDRPYLPTTSVSVCVVGQEELFFISSIRNLG